MKKSYLIITYCVLLIISTAIVSAIGIGPPRLILDFKPNLEKDIEYYIVNTIDSPVNVEMYVKGDLREYVTLEETSFKLGPRGTRNVVAHLALPAKIDKPGTNALKIGVLASPVTTEAATVAAKAGAESQLYIEVPYEGKYLSASMSVEDVKTGEMAELIVKVSNMGKEDINEISAVIEIYNSDDKRVATVSTDKNNLRAGEKKEIKAEWNTKEAKPGTYKAIALVDYDGEKKEISKSFNVGDVLLEIINLKSNEFKPGDIAKFVIDIESKWNEEIRDAYAVLEIYDENGKLAGSAESKEVDIPAWSKKQIDVFWDSTGTNYGKYKVKTILHYSGKTSEKTFDIEIKKKENTWVFILIGAVVLLAAYLVWSKWGKKSKKKKR